MAPRAAPKSTAERDLGLQDSDRFRIDAYWRMTPRQKMRLMYFDTSNEANKTLDRELIFSDTVYPVNLDVHAKIRNPVTELAYEFTFMHRDNVRSVGLGRHPQPEIRAPAFRASSMASPAEPDATRPRPTGPCRWWACMASGA